MRSLTTCAGYDSTQTKRYAITTLDAFSGILNLAANSSVNIGTVNVASAPAAGQRVVAMTLGTGATVGGTLNLTVSGTASGTLEYKADGAEGAGLYVASAPTPVTPEVTPSVSGTVDCGSADAAAAAADAINAAKSTYIKAPAASELSGEAATTYANLFTARADGTSVVVELNADGTNALETAATNVAAQVAADLSAVAATVGATAVSITGAQPGFYYSVVYDNNLRTLSSTAAIESDRALANAEGSVELRIPAKKVNATAGFYRVKVSAKAED